MNATSLRAYIGLGANLGRRQHTLQQALDGLEQHPDIRVIEVSSVYATEPWGVEEQPAFLNAVAALETTLQAAELLTVLKALELALGRQPSSQRWGPRVLDLDLLLLADECVQTDSLTLPHPRMHQRAFVLIPLLEIDAAIQIPGLGKAGQALAGLPAAERQGVRRHAELRLPGERDNRSDL